jgi:hypothetical protein
MWTHTAGSRLPGRPAGVLAPLSSPLASPSQQRPVRAALLLLGQQMARLSRVALTTRAPALLLLAPHQLQVQRLAGALDEGVTRGEAERQIPVSGKGFVVRQGNAAVRADGPQGRLSRDHRGGRSGRGGSGVVACVAGAAGRRQADGDQRGDLRLGYLEVPRRWLAGMRIDRVQLNGAVIRVRAEVVT